MFQWACESVCHLRRHARTLLATASDAFGDGLSSAMSDAIGLRPTVELVCERLIAMRLHSAARQCTDDAPLKGSVCVALVYAREDTGDRLVGLLGARYSYLEVWGYQWYDLAPLCRSTMPVPLHLCLESLPNGLAGIPPPPHACSAISSCGVGRLITSCRLSRASKTDFPLTLLRQP